MYYMLLCINITLANEFLTFVFATTYLCEAQSRPRRRRRLRSAGAKSSGAFYLRDRPPPAARRPRGAALYRKRLVTSQ